MKQQEMNSILRHDMLEMYFTKAGRIFCKDDITEKDLQELGNLTEQVISWHDNIMVLQYAKTISSACGENFRKYIKLNDLQDAIIKSKDEALMYDFASEVVGADIKEIMSHMYDAQLYKKLKREITPINELER